MNHQNKINHDLEEESNLKKILALALVGIFLMPMFSMLTLNIKAQQSTVDSWPMFQNDIANTGYSSSIGPTANTILWNFTAGGYVWSDVAVSGDIVYTADLDGNVYALDAATGALMWNYTTGGAEYSSPAIADGILFIGSMDRSVYAFGSSSTTQNGSSIPMTTYYIVVSIVLIIIVVAVTILILGRRKNES
jgi:hypothetical protein